MEDHCRASKTILVVDDHEEIRTLVARILSDHGYTVLTADSGKAAMQQSREHKGIIHLLLSDVEMPGMTGMDLSTKIYSERPEIHVMLMSGLTLGLLVLNEGWHFLHKPFIPSQLLTLVASVLKTPPTVFDLNEHSR